MDSDDRSESCTKIWTYQVLSTWDMILKTAKAQSLPSNIPVEVA